MRLATLVICVFCSATLAAPAGKGKKPAPKPEPAPVEQSHLERARQMLQAFEFEAALTELEFAQAQKPTAADQLEIASLRASAWSALDVGDKAAQAFADCLTLKESYAVPSTASPKVRDFFAKGRALFESRQQVTLSADAPILSETGATNLDVRVKSGARRVAELTFHFRLTDGTEAWQQQSFVRSSDASFSVKVPPIKQGVARKAQLAWYVQARDLAGGPVGHLGSAEQPQYLETQTQAAEAPAVPFYKSWVFWTAVGVGVGGAVATPFVVNAASSTPVPQGSLGQVKLR